MKDFFPDPDTADPNGLVAVSRFMSPELVLEAYRRGIFPWSSEPVRWYSPDSRAIFVRESIHIPKKLRKEMRANTYRVTFDICFEDVMRACAAQHASAGVWITTTFIRTYAKLHQSGHAHSVEVWRNDELVGGLYGIQQHGLFAGESMFHKVSNASKIAFAHLVRHLDTIGCPLIDAQVINDHTRSLGAVVVRRADYLLLLKQALLLRTPYDEKKWPSTSPHWDAHSWPY
ncbi:MAG: leucyl/phenylalanyl-tRNA--protein transferase [Clostridia bacterium]|nr:leucyl/phenylalanyl-tRNA--protein transferase [Deltaproteobacteria bacterium]